MKNNPLSAVKEADEGEQKQRGNMERSKRNLKKYVNLLPPSHSSKNLLMISVTTLDYR